jgi:hypothetical protein
MGKIESNFFISLDGVVELPEQWHFPYFNDEMGAAVDERVQRCGAFLMGRKPDDEWSSYCSTDTEESAALRGHARIPAATREERDVQDRRAEPRLRARCSVRRAT